MILFVGLFAICWGAYSVVFVGSLCEGCCLVDGVLVFRFGRRLGLVAYAAMGFCFDCNDLLVVVLVVVGLSGFVT